jgi:hypothetical protein
MKIEITSICGSPLYGGDFPGLATALMAAVKARANLDGANLDGVVTAARGELLMVGSYNYDDMSGTTGHKGEPRPPEANGPNFFDTLRSQMAALGCAKMEGLCQ